MTALNTYSYIPVQCHFLDIMSSRLRLIPCLPVVSILPSIMCCRRQFLRKV